MATDTPGVSTRGEGRSFLATTCAASRQRGVSVRCILGRDRYTVADLAAGSNWAIVEVGFTPPAIADVDLPVLPQRPRLAQRPERTV